MKADGEEVDQRRMMKMKRLLQITKKKESELDTVLIRSQMSAGKSVEGWLCRHLTAGSSLFFSHKHRAHSSLHSPLLLT